MIDLIKLVLDSGSFIPHGHCYLWKPGLLWLHILSDSLTALAYYSIPLTLFHFARKRQDLPFNWIFLLFATFITACGTTHLLDVWTLWHPIYWVSGTLKGVTAIVSLYTAMMMVSLVPKALALPSAAQLEAANQKLQQEIAERQQTEALLQQSEARYRAIVEDQTELICRFLPNGTLTFTNSAYCHYFGRTQEELIQHSYLPVVLEEDLVKAEGYLHQLSQAAPVTTITSQVIRPNGVRTQQWIVQAIFNQQGQTVEFQAVGRDITELKQTEERLQQSEERLNTIVTNISDGILVLSTSGEIRFANPAVVHLFGQQLNDRPFGIPSGAVSEIEVSSQDGTLKVIEMKSIAAEWMGEQVYILALRDVTERKHSELASHQLNQKLAREIAERQQAEIALRESEERFQAFMNHNPALCWITAANGRLLYFNPTYAQTLNLPNDYVAGNSDRSLYPSQFAQQYLHNIQHVAQTQQVLKVIEPYVSADGSMGEALVYKFPIPNRSGQCLVGGVAIDITERNQMEKALQESEERLQLALEASGDGLWDWNIVTGELYYSPRYLEMLGYEVGELAEVLTGWEQLVHPQDMPQVQNILEAHLQDGSIPYKIDYRVQTKSGEWKWINAYGKVMVRDRQGHPLRMVGIGRDISDRKRAEEALRQSEAKNRAMLAAIPDLLLRVKRDGTCLDFIQPTNTQSGTFIPINKHLAEVLPPQLLQYQLQRLEQALATGQLQIWEHQFIKGSRLCDEEVRLVPYGEDEVLVIVRDISDRKQTEKQLELQSIIVKNMAGGICLVKATDGMIVYTNPKFEQIFGYNPNELNGQHVSNLNYEDVQTNTRKIAQSIISKIISYGEATYEVRNRKKDGTLFWCRATSSIFEHPEHGMVIVTVQQNITEQKQAEEQIKASLKEKEILLKEIHHRVKNNLQIIYSMLRLQQRSLKDPQAAASLLDSQNRIEAIALIHEKLYRTENLAQVDFSEYISGVMSNLLSSYNTQSKNITLEIKLDPIFLDIDRAISCGMIINELVSNSLKYAFPTTEMGQIQVRFQADEQFNITLIVNDDGVGLAPDFDLSQADSLGLQLVQDFVEQLKGTIQINCSHGTEFSITFPGREA